MTFSIVAADVGAGDWGVAVASKFPAVGAVVPWARAGVGAVATQSWANTDYGPQGLALMAEGSSAQEALDRLVAGDEGRERRQAGMVDARGGAATFTGGGCLPWAGGLTGPGYACQGNILVGEEVVRAMARAFEEAGGGILSTGSSRPWSRAMRPAATGGDGRARRSSWCGRAAATRAGTTATWTSASTTTPRPSASWSGCSRSTTGRSWSGTTRSTP